MDISSKEKLGIAGVSIAIILGIVYFVFNKQSSNSNSSTYSVQGNEVINTNTNSSGQYTATNNPNNPNPYTQAQNGALYNLNYTSGLAVISSPSDVIMAALNGSPNTIVAFSNSLGSTAYPVVAYGSASAFISQVQVKYGAAIVVAQGSGPTPFTRVINGVMYNIST